MKQLDWRTFLIGLAFLSSTAFAMDTFYGDLGDEDFFFDKFVLIDGVELQDSAEDTEGVSTLELTGTGSLTVENTKWGTSVTVFGETTIQSERKWEAEDKKSWFEGIVPAPGRGIKPYYANVSFEDEGRHPHSRVKVLSAFTMGISNETFVFSTPAFFRFPTEIPDGTKLWLAFKEEGTPADEEDALWEIQEGDFCVATNGSCELELDRFNAVALVREHFTKCPRTTYSDTEIVNGVIAGIPECLITCDRGFELDYGTMKCLERGFANADTALSEEVQNWKFLSGIAEKPGRPGYYRYTGARPNQIDHELATEGLEGNDKYRVARINAASGNRSNDVIDEIVVEENKDAGLMEYLLQVRNFFGPGSSANVVRSEEATIDGEGEEVYSSAPLLPQTGPGLFLGLATLGLGFMVVGAKGRRK